MGLLVVLGATGRAYAEPTKDECVDADTHGQDARAAGKFRDARAQFEICVSPACPAIVRSDCTERLDDVTKNAPSIIFEVKDASGADLAQTSVTMDGKPLLTHLDGKAVPVDTGDHTFVFTAQGHLPNTQHVLVHDGDQGRHVRIVIGATATQEPSEVSEPVAPVAPVPVTPVTPTAPYWTGRRIAGVVTLGVGAVALGIGGVIGLVGLGQFNQATTEPFPAAHDDSLTAIATGNVATGVVIAGGVIAAAGLVIWLTAPSAHVQVGASGSGAWLRGTF